MAAFVKGNSGNVTPSGGHFSLALTGGVSTSGDLLIAIVSSSATDVSDITANPADTLASTWAQYSPVYSAQGGGLGVWYAFANGSGANTITFATTGTGGVDLLLLEYSGVSNPVVTDGETDNNSASTTSITSGNLTTTKTNDLLIFVGSCTSQPSGLSAGWTQRLWNAGNGDSVADKFTSSNAAYSYSATQVSGGYLSRLIAFQSTSSVINLNATVPIAPDTVLSFTAQLGLKPGVAVLPGTSLSFSGTLQQPDTIGLAPATIQTLTPGILAQKIAPTQLQNVLSLTANLTGPTLLSGINAPTPATVVTPRPRNIHSPQIYI